MQAAIERVRPPIREPVRRAHYGARGAARRRDEIAIPESKIKQIPGAQYANTALQHYEHTKRAYRKSHPLNGGPPPYSNVDCHPFAALGETPPLNRRSLLD